MRILLLGGTRMLGEATALALLDAGHELVLANRGTRDPAWAIGVERIVGDREDPGVLAAISGSGAEVVVDFSAYRGAQSAALVPHLPAATHLVHCSTGAVYLPVPDLPWTEQSPVGHWDLWGGYGVEKLRTEREVARAADAGHPVSVFRLPYVLGPRNYAQREEFVLNRVLDGAAVALPGGGKAALQFVTAAQVGAAVSAIVAEGGPVAGTVRTLNIADPRAVCTLAGFVDVCAEITGVATRTVEVAGPAGVPGVFDAANCVFPFPDESYLLDTTAARVLGVLPESRSVRDSLAEALEILRAEPQRRQWQRTAAERAVLGEHA